VALVRHSPAFEEAVRQLMAALGMAREDAEALALHYNDCRPVPDPVGQAFEPDVSP